VPRGDATALGANTASAHSFADELFTSQRLHLSSGLSTASEQNVRTRWVHLRNFATMVAFPRGKSAPVGGATSEVRP